ncbi:39S ribosomal protein L46, mitochondrial [Cephus cinctus]|uniref:Large ribosomal subunit protein mL46 n=1 Tax=Cephus cinctus TaxID=211228 RepID=A0AAJ7FQW8_CEPCN|nr:39S ribosomal protein L46, mitochondrial [Cephus cinctus]
MFRQSLRFCTGFSFSKAKALLQHDARWLATESANIKWDLMSAVCLERHPIISKPLNELEAKYQAMLNQIEYENSMKSDHEIRIELEKQLLQSQNQQNTEIDLDVVIKQTAQDFVDASEEEVKNFKFAPKITEADEKNVKTSLKRKLDKNLVLLVEQNVGNKTYWIPPQGLRSDGETLRQTAERVLSNICGQGLTVQFYGNAPIGVYKYRYPKDIRDQGLYGAKIFYFLAKYINGNVEETVKYQWLDKEELQAILPQGIHKSMSQFLIAD